MLMRQLSLCVAGVLIAGAATMAWAQDTSKVLSIVPQADLKILVPIWTTAFVTREDGYVIYDTLFGVDAKGAAQHKKIAAAIQLEICQSAILAPLGDYDVYSVIRKGVVSGIVPGPVNVVWNIRKS
jgi:hypothetical protein